MMRFTKLFDRLFPKASLDDDAAALRKKARADMKDDRVRVRLGDLLRRGGDDRGALIAYWEAAEINIAVENDSRALAILKQIVVLDARDAEAHVALARVYERLGRLRDAVGQHDLAAVALRREGRHDLATEMMKKAKDLDRACAEVEYIAPSKIEETIETILAPKHTQLIEASMLA
jgi:tetratricopeptide (TPR) repeat protein